MSAGRRRPGQEERTAARLLEQLLLAGKSDEARAAAARLKAEREARTRQAVFNPYQPRSQR